MNSLRVSNGHILANGRVLPAACLRLEGDHVVAVEAWPEAEAGSAADIDLDGGWLVPGFIDTQVNGGGGVLFNDRPSVDGIAAIGAAHVRFGTTGFLPTLISAPIDMIEIALQATDEAIAAGIPGVLGTHIEGPFINPVRKGIHSERMIRRLDSAVVDILCHPRRGVVMMTIAPEQIAPQDIARLVSAGVLLSAGHSNATYEQATAAFACGVRGATHLFNAMSPFNHRAPGMVGAALDLDTVFCGLIADGFHVSDPALRLAYRVKGADRIMLVSDAMPCMGMESGAFLLNGREITVAGGRCTDVDGTLAGSNLDMAAAVRIMIERTRAGMEDVSRMASGTPAAFLGLSHERGAIGPGLRADFVMLDAAMQPVGTWIGGIRQG